MSPFSQFLFTSGVENLRMIAQPTQTELHEVFAEIPPFRLTVSDVDRMAGLAHEELTESRQHHNCRPQRHE